MQTRALKKTESHAAYLVFFYSTIGFEFDAQDKLGWNSLGILRTSYTPLLMRELSSLSIAARHSRHCGEASASLTELGVVSSQGHERARPCVQVALG